jgi:hypothetical protein
LSYTRVARILRGFEACLQNGEMADVLKNVMADFSEVCSLGGSTVTLFCHSLMMTPECSSNSGNSTSSGMRRN